MNHSGRATDSRTMSSPCRACPLTCTGSTPVWITSAPRRYRPSMTRPTAHSLPGMGWALITTTSSGRRCSHLLSPAAISDRADIGSPWDPVETTHTLPGFHVVDVLHVDDVLGRKVEETQAPGQLDVLGHGTARGWPPSGPCRGRRRRPAARGGCGWRSRSRSSRRPVWASKSRRSVAPTWVSDSVKPGSSALVESDSSRRMPGSRRDGPDAGQVGEPAVHRA